MDGGMVGLLLGSNVLTGIVSAIVTPFFKAQAEAWKERSVESGRAKTKAERERLVRALNTASVIVLTVNGQRGWDQPRILQEVKSLKSGLYPRFSSQKIQRAWDKLRPCLITAGEAWLNRVLFPPDDLEELNELKEKFETISTGEIGIPFINSEFRA